MSSRSVRVFIGLPCGELARYSSFWQSYRDLDLTGIEILDGQSQGLYIDYQQNSCIRKMREAEEKFGQFDYFWLLNDDMSMPRATLQKLVAANKDIVVPIMLLHDLPFDTLFYDYRQEDGLYHHKYLEPGERGLTRGLAAGGGGMLIKREVFDAFEDPWWQTHWDFPTKENPGKGHPTRSTEDFDFCRKAEESGFEVWCDLDCPVGHTTIFTVWPIRQPDGTWTTGIERRGKFIIIPAAINPVTHTQNELDVQYK